MLKDPAVTEKTIKTPNNKIQKDKNRKVTVNKYILNKDVSKSGFDGASICNVIIL